jgi:hypothetical protein
MSQHSSENLAQIDSDISKLRAQIAQGKATGISQVEIQHLLGERSRRIAEISTTANSLGSNGSGDSQTGDR